VSTPAGQRTRQSAQQADHPWAVRGVSAGRGVHTAQCQRGPELTRSSANILPAATAKIGGRQASVCASGQMRSQPPPLATGTVQPLALHTATAGAGALRHGALVP